MSRPDRPTTSVAALTEPDPDREKVPDDPEFWPISSVPVTVSGAGGLRERSVAAPANNLSAGIDRPTRHVVVAIKSVGRQGLG